MTKPFAFVFYEKLLPGQQLANRLQDLGYRVQVISDAGLLEEQAQKEKPMFLVAEFSRAKPAISDAIVAMKKNPTTAHIPVLAYVVGSNPILRETARAVGATLVASERGLLEQLPELLEQILQVD